MFNYIDFLIVFILLFFLTGIFRSNIFIIFFDFLSFLVSIIFALKNYQITSALIARFFPLPDSFSDALGFFLTAALVETVLGTLVAIINKKIPKKYKHFPGSLLLSIFPAIAEGLILVSFILTLALSLPILPKFKNDITTSKFGGFLVAHTSFAQTSLGDIFNPLIKDTLTYLTVNPGSDKIVALDIAKTELTIDPESEKAMYALVNLERQKRGVGILVWREELVPVARAYAQDMWERQYFSHYSPEGQDVAGRLDGKNIIYSYVGENLALAPTLTIAHSGLMNSQGHRENILDPNFKRVGIGVVDNGLYGKIFVQIFTD